MTSHESRYATFLVRNGDATTVLPKATSYSRGKEHLTGAVRTSPQSVEYHLRELSSLGRELKTPMTLNLEHDRETGELVVSDDVVHAYGMGSTLQEAVANYEAMLLDIYQDLE